MATTAAILIAYRRELIDGGVPPELVQELVRDAAHLDVESRGLRVRIDATAEPAVTDMASFAAEHANPALIGPAH